ncbi:MAG: hypothetical protein PHV57_07895, partial [Methanomicrobiaceae archaeon]|nr:hypothetical protein [Methanomicrobiaceae archaeon]
QSSVWKGSNACRGIVSEGESSAGLLEDALCGGDAAAMPGRVILRDRFETSIQAEIGDRGRARALPTPARMRCPDTDLSAFDCPAMRGWEMAQNNHENLYNK